MATYYTRKLLAVALGRNEKLVRNRLLGIEAVFPALANEQDDRKRAGRPVVLYNFNDLVLFAAIVLAPGRLGANQREALRDTVADKHKAWKAAIEGADDDGYSIHFREDGSDPILDFDHPDMPSARMSVQRLAAYLKGRLAVVQEHRPSFYAAESFPPARKELSEESTEDAPAPENLRAFRKK